MTNLTRWTKRALLIGSALSWPLLAGGVHAQTLPTGGTVQAGTATIGPPGGGAMTIDQGSSRGVIDWTSFSIGAGGTVQFNNGSGATLNRVTGPTGSQLDGKLGATGSIYLLNPNGILVGAGGVVDVGGGFVASTLDLSNAAFMAGGDQTLQGGSTASVINLGKIGALGGSVVLAAQTVENKGLLGARDSVGLLAGSKVLLSDTAGPDGRFQVLVGDGDDSATNKGTIFSSIAELKAQGGNVYALAGDTRGVINAIGVSSDSGRVFLTPGAGGSVEVEGTTVTTRAQGGGGKILVGSSDTASATLAWNTLLDASADSGAGGSVETAGQTVRIPYGAKVTTQGQGGGADGVWTITQPGFRLADSGGTIDGWTLRDNLDRNNVVINSPAGDVRIDTVLGWTSDRSLTINSAGSLVLTQQIISTGASAKLTFTYGPGGDYGGEAITLQGANAGLNINGNEYTLIRSAAQLNALGGGSFYNPGTRNGYFALPYDIDLSSIPNYASFSLNSGVFAGLGHRVRNIHAAIVPAYAPGGSKGFIDTLGAGATVRDLGIDGGPIEATFSRAGFGVNIGALVASNYGTISNSWSTASVSGGSVQSAGTGGLVGGNYGTIRGSFAHGAVSGGTPFQFMGGLVGWNHAGGQIIDSHATGFVSGGSGASGGLVGENGRPTFYSGGDLAVITNSYATGYVSGNGAFAAGGLVGSNESGIINSSYATGAVDGGEGGGGGGRPATAGGGVYDNSGQGGVGGLVGFASNSTINDSYATGAVTSAPAIWTIGPTRVGGLVGYNTDLYGAAVINRSYATGSVAGGGNSNLNPNHMVGGLVGVNDGGQITDAYSTGAVIGWNGAGYAGGFAGQNTGTITNAYSTGTVGNTGTTGGFVGVNSGTIVRGYWDRDTSNLGNGFGANSGSAGLTALGAAAPFPSPYAQSSYAGFDFVSVWTPPSAGVRPKLR